MIRIGLILLLMFPLVLTGAVGLHTHEDGTCHTHPPVPCDDHGDDGADDPITIPGPHHGPGDSTCVRTLFPTADGIHLSGTLDLVLFADPIPTCRLPARLPSFTPSGPPVRAASCPLYLSHRHLVI